MVLARLLSFLLIFFCSFPTIFAQNKDTVRFVLSMDEPAAHKVHVVLKCHADNSPVDFKMPQWTPGYYQIMNFWRNLRDFQVTNDQGKILKWEKVNDFTWRVYPDRAGVLTLQYTVLADRSFVANSFIDTTHAYITPAATFLYIDHRLSSPASLTVEPYKDWSRVAVGLDSVAGKKYTYRSPDFDLLFDCPILAGNLEELPSFTVRGIPHRFIGYQLGDFDKVQFMADLKKIVGAAVKIMDDIPYKQYTFLAIGPGNGGIEHLTSSALSFTGKEVGRNKKRVLSFIAHEYFHHYNVKRVRPIELGPFDYDNGSKTRQLWISEGWTVYYEYILLKRAGIFTDNDLYIAFQNNMNAYETKTGRHYQSLAQASEDTWSDGPFGRKGDTIVKTISYYEKGPVVALMLDFAIRHHTGNRRSLDDVMRRLYREYYKKKKRGFTETEFQKVCQEVAGDPLTELFIYVNTTQELDYPKYFNYGGLAVDPVSEKGKAFSIHPMQNPGILEAEILKGWLIQD